MTTEAKIVLSVLASIVCAVALYIDWKPGPDWLWRGGRYDPIRNAVFRADGSTRRFAKPALALLLLAWLVDLWFAAPTKG